MARTAKPREQIEQDAQITAIDAVDQHAADERHHQAGQRYDDDLPAYGDRGMRGGHDVPAHADKVHATAEERDKHGGEEEAEGALLRAVSNPRGCRGGPSSLLVYYRKYPGLHRLRAMCEKCG